MAIPSFYRPEHFDKMSKEDIKEAARRNSFTLEDLLVERYIDMQRYQELNQISEDEHYYNMANRSSRPELADKYTTQYIKELLKGGQISEQGLRNHSIFSELELAELTDDHYYLIRAANSNERPELKRRYTDEFIRQLINTNQISEVLLRDRSIFPQVRLDEIMLRPVKPLEYWLADAPALLENRVDVFILGVAGSGKSSFLAGVLKAARDRGILDIQVIQDESGNVVTKHGYGYGNLLINSLERNLPIAATSYDFLTYVPVNFQDEKGEDRPLSFMEMSGELFQECYMKDKNQLSPKLQDYLFGENQKMITCVIDYSVHNSQRILDTQQWQHFDWFLKLLEINKTLSRCVSISILITKWDFAGNLTDSESIDAAQKFVEKEYLNLYKICERLKQKYNLRFKVITFSLGTFDGRNAVTYKPKDSEKILDWFIANSPRIVQRKRWYKF
ncbi:hypothetical protein EXU85_03640 [Spirosoma sp. KCTC 42546]|uniref:hypothetical protein n=1 Tax=Spirosoma sp. KCTC 42546 TaxID=2520506 RepID=UPI00115BB205|nr:hypothetical protein [Spirosoma sp. KCTC 42546]QDK77735.1 hypothetical protein EXU85_03640 [Spirosoma sp. KCTC 42546]